MDANEYPLNSQQKADRLEQQAVRQRWAIPETVRPAIVARQVQIATDESSSNREATAAAKCLVSMTGQNQRDDFRNANEGVSSPTRSVIILPAKDGQFVPPLPLTESQIDKAMDIMLGSVPSEECH